MSDVHFPQPVTRLPGKNVIFIVYSIIDTEDALVKIRNVAKNFAGLTRSMQNRYPDENFNAVMAFGAEAWSKYFPQMPVPKQLKTFEEIKGDRYTAVSTPGDLFFHIRSNEMGICYEFAAFLDDKLRGAVESIDETHGFRYRDGRDVIGFVDGTENPAIDREALEFAVIGDEDEGAQGGSYVFIQKYVHNMVAWNQLSTEDQSKAIGRHKYDDVELSDEEKPANAHNAVTNIGDDKKIFRANVPFANTSKGEYGTYFISYARDFSITLQMLNNMFIGDPVGNTDRLLDFSTALTGTLFYAPPYDVLNEIGTE